LIYPVSVSSESQDGQLDLLVSFSTNGAYSQVKDGKLRYDVYEVCDNPDCNESWLVDDFEYNGKKLAEQMGLGGFN